MFYVDVLDEVLEAASRLPEQTDLMLSVVRDDDADAVRARVAAWGRGRVTVRSVPNRGRDIAPKYLAFPEAFSGDYELILFLHTKKSTNEMLGPVWRRHLFDSLAGSAELVDLILGAFDAAPELGLVAPQHYAPIRPWIGWNGNYARAAEIADRMDVTVKPWMPPDFPSGSMFWARPAALAPILALGLRIEDFPPEPCPPKDTLMHALERLVYPGAERNGFFVAAVPPPGRLPATDIASVVRPRIKQSDSYRPSLHARGWAAGLAIRLTSADWARRLVSRFWHRVRCAG